MNKVQVKLFSTLNADALEYVPVFHQWIRERSLDELLIDVADYSHVKHGPDVALIGHEANYIIDRAMGRLGLLYAQKRFVSAPQNPWLWAIGRALKAAVHLQNEQSPTTRLTFRTDEMTLRVADRLAAPNTDETLDRFRGAISQSLGIVFGATPFEITRIGTIQDLFSVEVRAPGAAPITELVSRLPAKC